ncbi:unnamed protein product [Moneuplotes crassus]|uniref:Cyclic nucleotide-binding domain-containing protein n=1 Tax=Euplotes crassus TaxID=5936 RepID=A0AAD1XHH9_EUPCR|nr:unnamed protein product [Moneuplotes crassus]
MEKDSEIRSLSSAGSSSTTTNEGHETDHQLGNHIILYVLTGLLCGQVIKHITNKIKLPYTPLLALFGLIIGFAYEELGHWGDGADLISSIDPHTFFLIFLPPLIFESAFSIDWHIIKTEIVQILILAGPCLLVNAFLTALAMRFILQYDDEFTWEAAIMFGALISATDPVAVVSLLKELGASRTLSTMIEGESLINDGTAFVMFSVTLELVKGKSFDAGEIALDFVRLSFGGPLLGIVFGFIISLWLKRILNNSILETNLTIVGAYMVFYVAESWELEVSGILALVGLGLYMTKVGKTRISHQSEETLHHIWGYLGFACETLVFMIAGTIIALKVFEGESEIGWDDWLRLPALYIILHVIRLGMIFLLRWPLNKIGYGLSWAQAVVLGYSGLRGAVSLVLSLIVFLDSGVSDYIKDIVIFHTAGIAILTLVINGTTMGFVIRKLGLMRISEVKKKMLKNIVKAYRKEVGEVIEKMQENENYKKIDWEILKKMAKADEIKKKIFKKRSIKKEETDMIASAQLRNNDLMIDKAEYSFEELYQEAKHRYLTTLKGIYWDYFEEGQCSARTCLLLIESADRGIDHSEDTLKDFSFIKGYFNNSWWMRFIIKFKKVWLINHFVKNHLYNNISFIYDVTVNYVEGHEDCLNMIREIVHNEDILDKLSEEIHREHKHAVNMLHNDLEENFPEVIKAVQHKRGGFFLINKMREFVNEMIEHGQIDFKEAKLFLHELDKSNRSLELNRLKIDFEEADHDFMEHCEIATLFKKEDLENLCHSFKEQTYNKNDVIIRKDEMVKNLYYVSRGIVAEKNGAVDDPDAPKIKNKPGDLIGLQFLKKDEGRSFTNCYAKTVCTIRYFPISSFREMISDQEQERKLWGYIGPSIINLNPDKFERLQDFNGYQLKVLLKNSEYKSYEKGKILTFENGGILFEGWVEEVNEDDKGDDQESILSESEKGFGNRHKPKVKSYKFIYPTISKYKAKEHVCCFEFPKSLKESWLSFDPKVLFENFRDLPGALNTLTKRTLRQRTIRNKQKTHFLGVAKDLTHKDRVETIRKKSMADLENEKEDEKENIENAQTKLDFAKEIDSTERSIIPKGFSKAHFRPPIKVDTLMEDPTSEWPKTREVPKEDSKEESKDSGSKRMKTNTPPEKKDNVVHPIVEPLPHGSDVPIEDSHEQLRPEEKT